MRPFFWIVCAACAFAFNLASASWAFAQGEVKLPKPILKGRTSVEEALLKVRTVRNFSQKPLTLAHISQILWAANGNLPADAVTGATSKAIQSAGGLYPLEVFLVSGPETVSGIPAGVYRYNPTTNTLVTIASGDQRSAVGQAALGQMWLARAPALVIIAAEFSRTTSKYGERGIRYVAVEAGSSEQNVALQAASLGLRVGTVGAFHDLQVTQCLRLPPGISPLLIIAIGA